MLKDLVICICTMSAILNALDTLSSRTVGQNGHAQVEWKDGDFQEAIVQLFFQIVRVDKSYNNAYTSDKYEIIRKKYSELIELASNQVLYRAPLNYCLSLLFQTRDLEGGKGEYSLFYHLLSCWEKYWDCVSDQLTQALTLLFDTEYASNNFDITFSHPYGSWKDVKNILNVYRELFCWGDDHTQWSEYNVTRQVVGLAVDALNKDFCLVKEGKAPKTLVAKWLPREKSKLYGWQARIFAEHVASHAQIKGHKLKNWTVPLSTYRRYCSMINKKLGTTQIKQCAGEWSTIDFDNGVTSITMQKQKAAFLACGKNKEVAELEDRKACATNFRQYLSDVATGKKTVKASRVMGEQLIKELWNDTISEEEKSYANAVWDEVIKSSSPALSNALVMLDLSASMTWENCPFYAAIYLALKIACAPGGTKRVMTFSTDPSWISLEQCSTLTEMVDTLKQNAHSVGMSTDIYKAFNLVGNACLHRDLTPEEVGQQMVVILSDMQINQADSSRTYGSILEENITQDFERFGLSSSHGRPYPRPTLVFWNMKSTGGFPTSVVKPNTIMMSGYNSDVLESVASGGMEKLTDLVPWDHIKRILDTARYNWFW